jgi:hypothetical protein
MTLILVKLEGAKPEGWMLGGGPNLCSGEDASG